MARPALPLLVLLAAALGSGACRLGDSSDSEPPGPASEDASQAPPIRSRLRFDETPEDVALADTLLAVGLGSAGARLFDVTDPRAPALLASVDARADRVEYADGWLYTVALRSGLFGDGAEIAAFDALSPRRPVAIAERTVPTRIATDPKPRADGVRVVLPAGPEGLAVLAATTLAPLPRPPLEEAEVEDALLHRGEWILAVSERLSLAARWFGRDPERFLVRLRWRPGRFDEIDRTALPAWDGAPRLAATGASLLAVGPDRTLVFSLDPSGILPAGSVPLGGVAIAAHGGRALVADGRRVHRLDLRPPGDVRTTSWSFPAEVRSLDLFGGLGAVALENGEVLLLAVDEEPAGDPR